MVVKNDQTERFGHKNGTILKRIMCAKSTQWVLIEQIVCLIDTGEQGAMTEKTFCARKNRLEDPAGFEREREKYDGRITVWQGHVKRGTCPFEMKTKGFPLCYWF